MWKLKALKIRSWKILLKYEINKTKVTRGIHLLLVWNRSEIKVHAATTVSPPMSSMSSSNNHVLESLFSNSTTAYAICNICSLPSLPIAVNNSLPYLPFRKHPSNPIKGHTACETILACLQTCIEPPEN